MTVHLVKLCVGAEAVEDLIQWQVSQRDRNAARRYGHVTRMWPKREAELLDGGSLYWVFKGQILARQVILGLDEVIGEDGIRRCAIILDEPVIRTEPRPRRPFQGWRYLTPEDAPRDLGEVGRDATDLPAALSAALADIGVLPS